MLNKQTLNLFNFNYPLIKLDNTNVKVGTFFSGIGSPEMAFKRLKENEIIKNYESVFFCEVDKNSSIATNVIYYILRNLF